jgi:hypothetical protein
MLQLLKRQDDLIPPNAPTIGGGRPFLFWSVILLVLVLVGMLLHLSRSDKISVASVPVMPANAVSKQAYDWGLRTCLEPIDQISGFLTKGKKFSSLSLRGNQSTDGQLFMSTIASGDSASGSDSLSWMQVAPVVGGGCNSSYQTVTFFENACEDVRKRHFDKFTNQISFDERISAYGAGSGNVFAYFIPIASDKCVAMKMQVIF